MVGIINIPYEGYDPHPASSKSGSKIGAAKIVYSCSTNTYYLMIALEVEIPDINPEYIKGVMGFGGGWRNRAKVTASAP